MNLINQIAKEVERGFPLDLLSFRFFMMQYSILCNTSSTESVFQSIIYILYLAFHLFLDEKSFSSV